MGRMKARGALQTEEKEFGNRADRLADKPELLLPECASGKGRECSSCPFDKLGDQLKKAQQDKDDPGKLKFTSRWSWNKLVRAYAGFLTLRHSDKNLYFIVADLPAGKVGYLANAKAPREILIGVQHFDNPKWRLMAYLDYAKQGCNLYSARDRLFCSGKSPSPPPQYVKDTLSRTRYTLKSDGGDYRCPHLGPDTDLTYLTLKWRSAKVSVSVCENCASRDENLYCKLTETFLSRDPREDFDVMATFGLKCMSKCDDCALEGLALDPLLAERYLNGKVSDKEFLTDFVVDAQKMLSSKGKRLLVSGDNCYGSDIASFINALSPDEAEKAALEAVLGKIDRPVLLDSPTPSKVLSLCWADHGVDAIDAVVHDRKLAQKIFDTSGDTQPSTVLKDALMRKKEKDALADLPKYESLPTVADFANRLARTYRTMGATECARIIERVDKKDTKMRSAAYAFLVALGLHEGKQWQYSKDEKDFAQFLAEYARPLLDAKPDGYHQALQDFLTASGAGGEIRLKQ